MDTNKKFTPVEVAESLLKCASPVPCEGCIAIDRHNDCDCADFLKRTAADMIKELAAENARLQAELIQRNDELLKLREENRWIPVKERLPTKEDADTKGNVQVVFMEGVTTWNWRDISRVCEISHWMPLPEPPKEAGGERRV